MMKLFVSFDFLCEISGLLSRQQQQHQLYTFFLSAFFSRNFVITLTHARKGVFEAPVLCTPVVLQQLENVKLGSFIHLLYVV